MDLRYKTLRLVTPLGTSVTSWRVTAVDRAGVRLLNTHTQAESVETWSQVMSWLAQSALVID